MIACLGLSTFAAGVLVFVITRKLFVTPREMLRFLKMPDLDKSGSNLLVLHEGLSDREFENLLSGLTFIDSEKEEAGQLPIDFGRKIVITNFDSQPEDIARWRRRFDLVERVLEQVRHGFRDRDSVSVLIVTTIDPMYYLRRQVQEREGAASEEWKAILDRASSLLYRFPRVILTERAGYEYEYGYDHEYEYGYEHKPSAVDEEFGQTAELRRLASRLLSGQERAERAGNRQRISRRKPRPVIIAWSGRHAHGKRGTYWLNWRSTAGQILLVAKQFRS